MFVSGANICDFGYLENYPVTLDIPTMVIFLLSPLDLRHQRGAGQVGVSERNEWGRWIPERMPLQQESASSLQLHIAQLFSEV
jgi:hypothetical protein